MTAKELKESKARLNEKDAELKQLQKEHYEVRVNE
jgi:hypothetical protein